MHVKLKCVILGETVLNQKQVIACSSKEHEKWASDVWSEADTIQGENNKLLDQVNMMQKKNSDTTAGISNIVANLARTEE